MKRTDLLRYLMKNGCSYEREGKKHTLFYNPVSNKSVTIPRHREINNFTAKAICKDLDIPVMKIR